MKGYEKLVATGRRLESFSYIWTMITCKKVSCKSCPHGPYLYARWREGSKIRAIYIGRNVPAELAKYVEILR